MTVSAYTEMYLKEATQVIGALDKGQIDAMVGILAECRAIAARWYSLAHHERSVSTAAPLG